MPVDSCFYNDAIGYNADTSYNGTCAPPSSLIAAVRRRGISSSSEKEEHDRLKHLNKFVNLTILSEIAKVNNLPFNFNPNQIKVLSEDEPIEVNVWNKTLLLEPETIVTDVKVYALKDISKTDEIPNVSGELTTESGRLPYIQIEEGIINNDKESLDVEGEEYEEYEDEIIEVQAESINDMQVFGEIVTNTSKPEILTVETIEISKSNEIKEEISVETEKNSKDNEE